MVAAATRAAVSRAGALEDQAGIVKAYFSMPA